jgi:hypothetical protein
MQGSLGRAVFLSSSATQGLRSILRGFRRACFGEGNFWGCPRIHGVHRDFFVERGFVSAFSFAWLSPGFDSLSATDGLRSEMCDVCHTLVYERNAKGRCAF